MMNFLSYIYNIGSKLLFYHNSNKEFELYKEITKDSYSDNYYGHDTFSIFESIDKILYLIYANKYASIISYNLNTFEKINEIKKAHNKEISSFKYYLDIINKRDLILSVSSKENSIKLWDIKAWECIVKIEDIFERYKLTSGFIFINNAQINITLNNYNSIKIFDLNKNQIKEINIGSGDELLCINNFYDKKLSKNYIVLCTKFMIKSYDFNKDKIFHEYHNIKYSNKNFIINDEEEIIKLIAPGYDNIIRIWDFNSGDIIKEIKIESNEHDTLKSFCFLNNKFLFAGYDDNSIRLINLENGYVYQKLLGHKERVLTLKKVIHHKYGECLLSQGYRDDQIKLWKYKN